ncbi:hypothetical protein IJD15_05705 [bacterium]|nr:hypothetical protein [bacterium]
MKNIVYKLLLLFIFCMVTPAIAADFSYLKDLTPVQKQKLERYGYSYQQNIHSLDMRIDNYRNKIKQINSQQNVPKQQADLLIFSYEKNIKTLVAQKDELKEKMDSQYKSILTEEQYKQYSAHPVLVQNAFSDFLRK